MRECHRDESGQLPAKTIVFALTQDHAVRLADVFQQMYPQYTDLVKVITHKSDYKGQAIRQFKHEELPRIAISVDMLDTGIDVPEVMNLVFMKPVQSYIKLWQMIGRGTRSQTAVKYPHRLPNGRKESFLILDFWDNDLKKSPQQETERQNVPVLVTVFNTRLKILETLLHNRHDPATVQTIHDLRAMIARIPLDSFTVKKVYHQIEPVWQDSYWNYITQDKIDFLRLQVGPLLREVAGVDVTAETFTSKIERLKAQIVGGQNPQKAVEAIAEDAGRLPDSVLHTPQQKQARDFCLSPQLLTATVAQLNDVIRELAGLMRNKSERISTPLILDLKDYIERQSYVFLFDQERPIYVTEYQERVANKVLELLVGHPAVEAIEKGQGVGDELLLDLERLLRQELGKPGVQLTEAKIKLAYGWKVDSFMAFVRELLALDGIPDYREVVGRQFERFAQTNQLTGAQLQFLRAVQSVFLQKRRLALADLYDAPPLKAFGMDAVERFFTQAQQTQLLQFTQTLEV